MNRDSLPLFRAADLGDAVLAALVQSSVASLGRVGALLRNEPGAEGGDKQLAFERAAEDVRRVVERVRVLVLMGETDSVSESWRAAPPEERRAPTGPHPGRDATFAEFVAWLATTPRAKDATPLLQSDTERA